MACGAALSGGPRLEYLARKGYIKQRMKDEGGRTKAGARDGKRGDWGL